MRHRNPEPDSLRLAPWIVRTIATGAVFGIVVPPAALMAQTVAPEAQARAAVTLPQVADYADEPTLPVTFGPLRSIFTPVASRAERDDVAVPEQTTPAIATNAPLSDETPLASVPDSPQATHEVPEATQPVEPTTPAPATTQPPAPTTTTAATTSTLSATPTATSTPAPTTAEETTVPLPEVTVEVEEP